MRKPFAFGSPPKLNHPNRYRSDMGQQEQETLFLHRVSVRIKSIITMR